MKRALLIAGGTVGGLGAVLAITPPQLSSVTSAGSLSSSLGGATAAKSVAATTAPAATTPSATKTAPASKATKKAPAGATASASASATASATASQAPTTAPAATSGYSGTVTGATVAARNYGNLSATVTFANGQISHVSASQSPSSWSQNSLSVLLPFVNGGKVTVEQVKSYAAEQLPCAISNSCRSQASFTATAFWTSIKSAITKAGL